VLLIHSEIIAMRPAFELEEYYELIDKCTNVVNAIYSLPEANQPFPVIISSPVK
jgi:hypothetical protein